MVWRVNRQGRPLSAAETATDTAKQSNEMHVLESDVEAQLNELHRALTAVTAEKDHYLTLYDLAPAGYLTLSESGSIMEMNVRAAGLLADDRHYWIGRNFKFLIVAEDQCVYFQTWQRLFETSEPQTCELRMFRKRSSFWASLDMALANEDGEPVCRLVVSDAAGRKTAELEREQTIQDLQRSLDQNNILIREMYHRVKNNLQVISSLLRMQSELLTGHEASSPLKECQQRIGSMALIHEHLYGSESRDQVDFGAFTRSLVGELANSYGRSNEINCTLNATAVMLSAEKAIPCGLMVNELVTNAFKYAYPRGQAGEVRVDLREKRTGIVTLAISDDGVGLPPGLDWSNSDSMGLPIVDALARQIGATLTVERKAGTSVIIEFSREDLSLAASQ